MPSYKFWEAPFYGVGLKMYDALAGKDGLGPTEFLSRTETLGYLPTVQSQGPNGRLRGGVKYWDGQFDDARLALALARTAARQGALLVNYCAATGLIHENGKLVGLHAQDQETGRSFELKAKCVVNAAGVWVDQLRLQDGQAIGRDTQPMVAPSQGVHIVVDRSFLPTDHAMLIPKTADGRVLFAVPWLGKTILGTTDTPRHDLAREPLPFKEEVDFILRESARYLTRAPCPADIKSIWVGLRPLVKPPDDDAGNTQALSREHTVLVSKSGLVTVTGGKWTTYRAMAEDVLSKCFDANLLPARTGKATVHLKLVGARASKHKISDAPGVHLYGGEAEAVQRLPGASHELGGGLTEAMVRFAARYEYARCVEDVLARRSRLLFLDAALARSMAAEVAALLQQENGVDPQLDAFLALCGQYLSLPTDAA
jgi:glycerol-3-phosphate dehydrogenase